MKKVSIYRPTSMDEAIQILTLHGTQAGVYAGGTDLLIRLKNRLDQAPSYLVDVKGIPNLSYIRENATGGVDIGALTKLSEIADSALVGRKYPMLIEAMNMISSPELRNASTLGGDLLQEVWCQYLRGGYACYRNGGYICHGAIGDNSYYHSAMGGRLCYAVYPGDAAPALIPFDATVKLVGAARDEGVECGTVGTGGHDGGWEDPVACGAVQRDIDGSDAAGATGGVPGVV